jgi:type I restriction enzyme S subunit
MKSNKPKIRFEGFDEEWEEKKLLDTIDKVIDFRGRTPKKLGMDWSDTGFLALSALNVKNGYIDTSTEAHYGSQELYDKWMTGNELHKNQVLFTTEAPMGNVAQIPNEHRYILSQRTIAFNVNRNLITEDFLAIALGSPKMFLKLSSLSSGGTAKGVSQKSLATVDLWLSKDIPEQTKIGNFFKHLDGLIALHQQQYDKQVIVKKAMLEKMFPKSGATVPEIRFKGFEGDWEEKTLGEVVKLENGFAFKSKYFSDSPTNSIVLTPGNVNIGGGFQKGKGRFYDTAREFPEKYILKYQDIFVTMTDLTPTAQTLGLPAMIPDDGNTYLLNQRLGKITGFEGDIFFLFQLLSSEQNHSQIVKTASGSTVKHSSPQRILDCVNYFPSNKEQEKVGSYFQKLDELLTLHQGELAKLKNIKKALLEKMFV